VGDPKARPEDGFQQDLIALIPQLRAFARSLCRDAAQADDLAQDALASAWQARDTFQAGTNMRAWVYVILRNKFYSDARRAARSTSLNPEVAEATLRARDNVESILELDEVRRALARLTDQHREALVLVGVGGFSHDEAAEILKIPTGTVKSRVCRARMALADLLATGHSQVERHPAGSAFDAIVGLIAAHETRHGRAAYETHVMHNKRLGAGNLTPAGRNSPYPTL
jgi:RNA polymerase sigma-70 factor (ECF subfamily)